MFCNTGLLQNLVKHLSSILDSWQGTQYLRILYQGSGKPGKPGKNCFLWHSGKTWKTQGILRKYFKFLENSGNSVEIDFLINLHYFLATIYFKWSLLFTLYTTVIPGFFYLHIYLVWVTGCCLKWPTLGVYFEMQ